MRYTSSKGVPVQKSRKRLVIFALVTTVILSCGIPTSMPILPKEVVVKASPSVSVPLGKVNYNLYSGINGGNMKEKLGGLDNLLGAGWLQDLQEQGAAIYDYRPDGEDNTQKFLIHYKLNMEDTLDSSSEFNLSEYKDMLDGLTGDPHKIDDVSFPIPAVEMKDPVDVDIKLDEVTKVISDNLDNLGNYTAYLPVVKAEYYFPELPDFPTFPDIPTNTNQDFSVTLPGLDSLTLTHGKLRFEFTLTYGLSKAPPPQGAGLKISEFTLRPRPIGSQDSITITERGGNVNLDSFKPADNTFISFNGVLPQNFDLVCKLEITGSNSGYFNLDIKPVFENFTISGVEGLELEKSQLDSLYYDLNMKHEIDGDLGDSFQAQIKTGSLVIDPEKNVFPPLPNPPNPYVEGWNLEMNLAELSIKQEDSSYEGNGLTVDVKGLSLGESLGESSPPVLSNTDLQGQFLNNQDVIINGRITMGIPCPEISKDVKKLKQLTFQNFPGGIIKEKNTSYIKTIDVVLNVSLFSTVTVKAEDFGLDKINQEIEQELGDDFNSFRPWLNYIQFARGNRKDPDRGLGVALKIEKLNIMDGLSLIIDAPVFGLEMESRPLVKQDPKTGGNGDNAELVFTNEKIGYQLRGDDPRLPENGEKLIIKVKLGLENPGYQSHYEKTGILTLENVEPGFTIKMEEATAQLLFNWTEMSVKPQPKPKPIEGEDPDDFLPDYPFTGTYPDKGEDGIDLSGIPKGLGFYIPEEGDKAGEGISANLYISLKRQQQLTDGNWVDEDGGDPGGKDYDKADPNGWRRNLKVNLPSLDFRAIHGDNKSENLFTYNQDEVKDTGDWALFKPIDLETREFADQGMVKKDEANKDNPFKIYSSPTLPEPDKAIPIGNLAKVFNENLIGGKDLYFEYTVKLSNASNDKSGSLEPEEIRLYPEMLEKRIAVSVDLLIVVPLQFMAIPDPGNPEAPVVITIDPDLGDDDLFGRTSGDDNEYFDLVKSLGFDINIKNLAGLSAGRFFLENKTDKESNYYRTSRPIIDFSNTQNKFSLDSGELETIKGIYPFTPQVAIEFDPGKVVRIARNFNIELQSITIKAGGEYTFETGW
jgi:hypothetical protein